MLPENCPKCLKSFQGDPIPPAAKETLGTEATHYSLVLGHIPEGRDSITSWECLFCGHSWPRKGARPQEGANIAPL